MVASLFVGVLGVSGIAGMQAATATAATGVACGAGSAPNGDNGTTIDPLQYNCGNDAPTCGQVGESNGYYNGTNVDLLYSEDYYCDPAVTSHDAATGCEAGTGPSSPNPSGQSANGTILGNTKHGDTLYIPVPVGYHPTADPMHRYRHLHRPSIDHRPVALAGYLGGRQSLDPRHGAHPGP